MSRRWDCIRYAHASIGRARRNRYTGAMFEAVRRTFTFTIGAMLVSYVIFMLIGATLYARADEQSRAVWIRDEITPNTHRIAGLIPVPSSCSELTEKTERLSPVVFKLKFTTWENPTIGKCSGDVSQRQFYDIVFAPAIGVHFIATIDDVPIPIIVVPYRP